MSTSSGPGGWLRRQRGLTPTRTGGRLRRQGGLRSGAPRASRLFLDYDVQVMNGVRRILAVLLLLAAPTALRAEVEITPFVGGRFEGQFQDKPVAQVLEFDESTSFGVIIDFDLGDAASAQLVIYGPDGRKIRGLYNGEAAPGRHRVTWNLRDDRNRLVPPGVYFCMLQTGSIVEREKIVLLR